MWRGRYFSSTHAPFCAQELASFGGRSIKNATGRIGYDRVSVNSRGEMRVFPPPLFLSANRGASRCVIERNSMYKSKHCITESPQVILH